MYLVFAPTAYFSFDPSATRSVTISTPYIGDILAYDHDDVTSVIRFQKHCSFIGEISGIGVLFAIDGFNYFELKLYFGTPSTHYIETFDLTADLAAIAAATSGARHSFTRSSFYNGHSVTIDLWNGGSGNILFQCEDVNSAS